MNAHTPAPTPPSDDVADGDAAWAARVVKRQVERLDRLAEAGTELALAIKAAAIDDPAQHDGAGKAFARVTRSVRLCGLLQIRLLADLQRMRSWDETLAERARDAAERQAAEDRAQADPAYGHKARVEAVVARVAKASTDDQDRIERLIAETGERLDDDDIYGDVTTRPIGELVALICRDLDIKPDWPRLAEEAWAQEEIDHPRSPFARLKGCARPPPFAGEGDPKGGGGTPHHGPMPPQSASLTELPRAGEHAFDSFPDFLRGP